MSIALPSSESLHDSRSGEGLLSRVLTAALWNGASVGLARVFNAASLIVASRCLGPAQYGTLGLTNNTVAMLGVFAGFGLGISASKLVSQHGRTDPARAGDTISSLLAVAIIGGSVAALMTIWCGPMLGKALLDSAEVGSLLQFAAILLVLNVVQGVQHGTFVGLEDVRAMAGVQLIGGLATVCLIFFGARWGGVWGCLCVQAAAMSIQVAIAQVELCRMASKRSIPLGWPRFRWFWRDFRDFGFPAALASMLVIPVEWLVSVMLANRPGGYEELGVYAASWQWVSPLLLVPSVVGQSILPIFSGRSSASDHKGTFRVLATAIAINAAAVLPLALCGVLFSSTLLSLSGPEFVRGEIALQLLFAAVIIHALETPVAAYLAGHGWAWIACLSNLGWGICLLAGVTVLESNGAQGVATARLLSYLASGIWLFVLVWRLQGMMKRQA